MVRLHCVVAFLCTSSKRRRFRAIEKMGGAPGLQRSTNSTVLYTPARAVGGGRTQPRIHNGGEPFAPGKSRISFHYHSECIEETHEYANEPGKQDRKNPTKIPKSSLNHERLSRTIEKISKVTPRATVANLAIAML